MGAQTRTDAFGTPQPAGTRLDAERGAGEFLGRKCHRRNDHRDAVRGRSAGGRWEAQSFNFRKRRRSPVATPSLCSVGHAVLPGVSGKVGARVVESPIAELRERHESTARSPSPGAAP